MASFYDEVEIEDMVFDEARAAYFYPCPCGDKFVISLVRRPLHLNTNCRMRAAACDVCTLCTFMFVHVVVCVHLYLYVCARGGVCSSLTGRFDRRRRGCALPVL